MHTMTFTLSERVTYGIVGMCFLTGFVGTCVSVYLLATAKRRQFPKGRLLFVSILVLLLLLFLHVVAMTGRQLLYGL
jgi:hypothetical protein